MTDFLLRTFVKNHEETNDPDVRDRIGSLASITGIILNILLVAGKITTGIISGSVSVIADGLNNLMDTTSSVVTLIGFKISGKKADKEHPFGHGRFEYLSGLVVAVLVLLVGIELGKSSFDKILNPTPVEYGWLTLGILVVSVLAKLWMAHFSKNLGEKIDSTTLNAVSTDSRNDVIATSAVLIAALIYRFSTINLDGWAGLGVAILIIYSGIDLIKETSSPLLGESPSTELVDSITKKIKSYDYALGIHDLIVHDYGPRKRYASVHVELSCNSNTEPKIIHEMIERIEKDFIQEENIHLVIHFDPVENDCDK
jgi:cation diffusion facilitator family transporter